MKVYVGGELTKAEWASALAYYIITTNATVRETAKAFNCSKSTVWATVTGPYVPAGVRKKVRKILGEHFATRHIHGGEATKKKYEAIRAAKAAKMS